MRGVGAGIGWPDNKADWDNPETLPLLSLVALDHLGYARASNSASEAVLPPGNTSGTFGAPGGLSRTDGKGDIRALGMNSGAADRSEVCMGTRGGDMKEVAGDACGGDIKEVAGGVVVVGRDHAPAKAEMGMDVTGSEEDGGKGRVAETGLGMDRVCVNGSILGELPGLEALSGGVVHEGDVGVVIKPELDWLAVT